MASGDLSLTATTSVYTVLLIPGVNVIRLNHVWKQTGFETHFNAGGKGMYECTSTGLKVAALYSSM